jgi:hypothetical protein
MTEPIANIVYGMLLGLLLSGLLIGVAEYCIYKYKNKLRNEYVKIHGDEDIPEFLK